MNERVRLISLRNQRIIADQCEVAVSFFARLRGWIGKTQAVSGEGILFPECSSIHMWFMSIPIDVVFLGERRVVTSVHRSVRPWRFLPLTDGRARETLELPAGTIERIGIAPGDELCIG